MKKLGLLFLAGVVAFGLSSCGGDDDPDEAKPTPKFDFVTGAGYTSSNATVDAGTTIKVGIDATGSENLESVGVRVKTTGGSETIVPLTLTGDSIITSLKVKNFKLDFEYQVGSLPTTEVLTVIVKMSNGTQTSKSIALTVQAAAKQVQDAPGRQLGGQTNSSLGSYWSMETNSAALQSDANSNPASIDWVYYHGATNQATFAAPDDNTLLSSNVMNNPQLVNWSPKNATRFKKASASFDFENLAQSTELQAEISAGAPSLTTITKLAAGDVYIFTTAGNKEYGAIKIVGINPANSAGVISFDMKFISEQ